jgi:hypothetical protein
VISEEQPQDYERELLERWKHAMSTNTVTPDLLREVDEFNKMREEADILGGKVVRKTMEELIEENRDFYNDVMLDLHELFAMTEGR